jgi:hypothetical protein
MAYLGFPLAAFASAYLADGPGEWRGMSRAGDRHALFVSVAWLAVQLAFAVVLYLASPWRNFISLGAGLFGGVAAAWLARSLPALAHRRGRRRDEAGSVGQWHIHAPGKRLMLASLCTALAVFLYPRRAATPELRGRSVADHVGALATVVAFNALAYADAWIESGSHRHGQASGGAGAATAEVCLVAWAAALCAWLDMFVHAATRGAGSDATVTAATLLVFGLGQICISVVTVVAPRW